MAPIAPDQTPGGWDNAADDYEREVMPFTRQYAEEALRVVGLAPGARVLDVATGTGALAFAAAQQGARVTAIDFSPQMIARLKRRMESERVRGIETEVMDGQALTFPANTFDAAFSIFGLIFFPDRAKGFREMYRVVRPGGRAAVAGWSAVERMGTIHTMMQAVQAVAPDMPRPPQPPAALSLQDPKRFEAEMIDAGFRDVRIHTVVYDRTFPSPEACWTSMTAKSPLFAPTREWLGPERLEQVREAMLANLRGRFGDGPVSLPCEAHIGTGVK